MKLDNKKQEKNAGTRNSGKQIQKTKNEKICYSHSAEAPEYQAPTIKKISYLVTVYNMHIPVNFVM